MDFVKIARELATALQEAAGTEDAVLKVRATGGSLALDAWSASRDHMRVSGSALRGLFDATPGTYELRLRHDGTYTFAAGGALSPTGDGWLVFDEDFRYPGHPLPGLPRPAAAAPTGAPTDPAVLAEITALGTEFTTHYTRITGHAPQWPAGRTEADLAAAEARIGARLPEDLRALYRLADGDPEETALLGPYSCNPLDRVVADHLEGTPGAYGWEDAVSDTGVVFDPPPFGHVKRLSRNDWWIPFGSDRAMNYLCADLDPGPTGTAGQVLEFGRDIHGPLRYVAPSITAMLREVVEALREGRYTYEDEEYLEPEVTLREDKVRTHSEIFNRALHEVTDPGLVQQVYLNDLAVLDLAVLQGFPAVRELRVNRAGTVTGGLATLPALEALRLEAAEADLDAFAGHPLWRLELKGLARSVALHRLAALPNLIALDVAGVDVPEIDRIAELPHLRVLAVSPAQLTHLLTSGAPLPRLAALRVDPRTPLTEAAALWSRFSPGREAPWYTESTGRV
ncbi:SMI1/KNR4 family protein [Amycolatopsis rhabdoformis]|uniref:SMI1/KNR4 family protein n=1 Tax=Amycolatopsis rhabdoformis TaxID=1448059 RepID=A0ABZ1I9U4_9PSEU|nr:SMI1/KNR4 family protein [Amycolatopsis rhabdoformis]WSE31190.1 SMI1/KNR4 family protein [Amycolatopsis rhabdoformis]